ncbi:MAG: hypothetical protein K0V04_16775 [Deltaproteobacteria bacterium]|nr:hypothetical protein [Deltaproteobacteria bacterium]
MLAASLVVGCNNDSTPSEAAPTVEASADAEVQPEGNGSAPPGTDATSRDPPVPSVSSAPPRHINVSAADRKPLLGHIAVAPIETLVAKTRTQLVPAALSSMVTVDALVAAVAKRGKGELTEAGIEHLDKTKPVVCALVDPLEFEFPGGCAFAYEGGAARVIADTPGGKALSADGHAAHMASKSGLDYYLDERDGWVVQSRDPEFFAEAGDALIRLAKAPSGRDFEAVLYPSVVEQLYLPMVREELELVATGVRTGSQLRAKLETMAWGEIKKGLSSVDMDVDGEDESFVQKTLARLDKLTPADARTALDELEQWPAFIEQIDTVGLGLELEPAGLVLSTWYDSMPGSTLQAELLAGPKVDREWLAVLPPSSVFAGASVDGVTPTDLPSLSGDDDNSPVTEALIEMLSELYAERTGNPASAIEPEVRALFEERAKLYGPRTAWSLYTDPAGPGGLAVVLDNQPGMSGRAGWKTWAERFTARNVLGEEAAQYLTWDHKEAVFESEGVPVDRWTVSLTAKLGTRLEREVWLAAAGRYLVARGGFEVHLDRVEKDDRTSFVFAPVGPEAYVEAALKAQGTKSLAPGLDTIVGRGAHPVSLWGLDLHGVLESVREHGGSEVPAVVRDAKVGTDLADVYGVSYLRANGGAAELVISQRLIDLATR